jgi:hypothetical protein
MAAPPPPPYALQEAVATLLAVDGSPGEAEAEDALAVLTDFVEQPATCNAVYEARARAGAGGLRRSLPDVLAFVRRRHCCLA